MSLLLLAKLLGHGADLLLVLLELLLSLLLLDVELDELFLFVWQSLLVLEVLFNELALLTLNVLDRLLGLVYLGDVVLHVIADLDVGLLENAEFIGQLLLALVGLVFGGHEDADLLDKTLVLLHHLLFLLFDGAGLGLLLFDGLDAVVEFGHAITKLTEEVHVLEKHEVSLLLEVLDGIILVRLQGRELMLAGVNAGEFLAALLIFDFDIFFKLVNALDIFVGTDDILEVL
jgi:hypothetical protein